MTTDLHTDDRQHDHDHDPHADASFAAARHRSDEAYRRLDHEPGEPAAAVMLSGDRPTGPLHVGHDLGSLRPRVALQERGVRGFVVIADYQVVTDRDGVGELAENVRGCVLDYLAAGIDPSRSPVFAHSAVPELNQLMLPLLALVSDAELRRNPTVKDELAATDGRPLSGLLLTYPVHQAADILFCRGTHVPVGRDNLPHVEQARVIARRFNQRFASGRTVFAEPVGLLTQVPLLLGLDGRKMSKSRGNTIPLSATSDETAAAIRAARTDADRRITFDPEARPEVSNLLVLAASYLGISPHAVAEQVGDGGAVALKRMATEAVNEGLRGHRARRRELEADPDVVESVLRDGNERAREVAAATLREVRDAMQMTY